MSYQVFARKYRPRTCDDVLGQDHVVRTLRNAIAQNRLAHAYLFVGPRGTGKTSTARILAKALNCTGGPKVDFDPDEDVCEEIAEGRSLDVLEIDGASNNGVEQVRDLRESVRFAPARGQFKIFYIDEVHMLSNAAFNALLKTLEEPPPHVKFIFATTEPNKILPTILSRCQRFDLRPIPTELIASHLQHIAGEEKITLAPAAAWAIAKGADGGMRDAQSMLDQLVAFCGEAIEESHVLDVFGFTSREKVASLTETLLLKNTPEALAIIQKEAESGRELSQLLGELIGCLRALLVAKLDPSADGDGIPPELWSKLIDTASRYPVDRILAAIDVFAETEGRMKWAANKRLHFELGIIKAVQTLDEVRLQDVLRLLSGKADSLPTTLDIPRPSEPVAQATAVTAAPEIPAATIPKVGELEKSSETPAPPAEPIVAAEPIAPAEPIVAADAPAPVEPATSAIPTAEPEEPVIHTRFKGLAEAMAAAPEESEAPAAVESPPWQEDSKSSVPEVAAKPTEPRSPEEDPFYQDPLIQAALERFEARIINP